MKKMIKKYLKKTELKMNKINIYFIFDINKGSWYI